MRITTTILILSIFILLSGTYLGTQQLSAAVDSPNVAMTGTSVRITRGPYLQMNTSTSILIRWRTDLATDSVIYWSANETSQNLVAKDTASTTEHEIMLSNLKNNVQYYYRVADSTGLLKKKRFGFVSPPDDGHPDPTRAWILGDFGGQRAVAKSVVKAYKGFNK